jgi:hypothetical protein
MTKRACAECRKEITPRWCVVCLLFDFQGVMIRLIGTML